MLFRPDDLQKAINLNFHKKVFSPEQTEEIVKKLNNEFELALSAEWEVLIINILSRIGQIKVEAQFKEKRPDIFFESKIFDLEFLADITSVSDLGIEQVNPTIYFQAKFKELIYKNDLDLNKFHCEFYGISDGTLANKSIKLKIPKRNDFHNEIFNASLHIFLDEIKNDPQQKRKHIIKNENYDISINYNPAQGSFTVSKPADGAYPPFKNNAFRNALKTKAKQLKKSEYSGLKGIFLCDAGSDMFFFRRDGIVFGSESTIRDFLRQNTSIKFVILLFVERTAFEVKGELFTNNCSVSETENLKLFLETILSNFPRAQTNAPSAMQHFLEMKILGNLDWYWRNVYVDPSNV